MHAFMDILRCILCCDDEEQYVIDRERSRDSYTRVESDDSFSRITTHNTDSLFRDQSVTPQGTKKTSGLLPSGSFTTSSFHSSAHQGTNTNLGDTKTSDQKLYYNVFSSSPHPPQFSSKFPLSSSSKPLPSKSEHSPSSRTDSSSSWSSSGTRTAKKSDLLSAKSTLLQTSLDPTGSQNKAGYVKIEKGTSPTYVVPQDIKALIEKDILPEVLKKPLSKKTYQDYFRSLLFAEDCYIEKWDDFEMKDVTLELEEAAIYTNRGGYMSWNDDVEKDEKIFVAFEIDKVPGRRPFLLSRDFVSVWLPDRTEFQLNLNPELLYSSRCRWGSMEQSHKIGIIYRVVNGNRVLAEFGEEFYSQHKPSCKYVVKFSFNRVCLKRAHQAIASVSDLLLVNFLFPDCVPKNELLSTQSVGKNKLDRQQASALHHILSLRGVPPYLVEGPISVNKKKQLSGTGLLIVEAVLQIYRTSRSSRVLLCAPVNRTCDVLLRELKKEIPETDMFRANAAFRELDGVPIDILPSCLYERKMECFSCPSLKELQKFKVILSTFMSCFRLYNEGIHAGHFSHIFLVDASSAIEPEVIVPLSNLANERTVVVVTGAPGNRSGWVHSPIARKNGLMISYFERLSKSKPYESRDPTVITVLTDAVGR